MIKTFFANFLYQVASLIVVVLVIGGAVWAYAAFTEPAAAPSASNQDFTQNILGANNADNSFSSASVAANVDGSIIERLEHLWTQLNPKLSNIDATISSRALDSEIGGASDSASMSTTLFAGQQYLWDNRASFGSSWTQCAYFTDTAGNDISSTWDDACTSYKELLFLCSYSAGYFGWAEAPFFVVPNFLGLAETSDVPRDFNARDNYIIRSRPSQYIDVYTGSSFKFYVTHSGTGVEEGAYCGGNDLTSYSGDAYWIYGR